MPFLMSQFTGQQEAQADLALKQQQLQANAFRLQQAQKAEQQQEDYFSTLQESLKEQPTPTQGSVTPEGQVTSPTISILEKAVRASKNVDQYNSAIKALDSARKTEADVQLKNLQIKKDKDEHIVAAAMHGLSTGDIVGAIAMYAQYDPKEALQAYSMMSKATPEQQKTILQRLIAEHSTGKEMADIQQKQLNERDKEQYRQESLELRRQAQADRRADQAARREERREAREEKSTSKAADYRAASRQAETAHAHYQRRYDSLKKSLRSATTEDEKKVIISDMEDLNSAYEEDKNRMRQEWEDKGLKVKWPGETKAPSLKESGKTKDTPVEISSEEEASKLPKGTWIKMGNRIGQVK